MSIWIQISAGQHGPRECQLAVTKAARALEQEGLAAGAKLIWREPDPRSGDVPDLNHAVVFSLVGTAVPSWLQSWLGTIKWECKSPFRPTHGRRNWFVSVNVITAPERGNWDLKDVKVETFRASGPGGQKVNKTDSAVRLIHVPTGISVEAQDERSQHQNRRLAEERLRKALKVLDDGNYNDAVRSLWRQHHMLERGNEIRTYAGPDFVRVS